MAIRFMEVWQTRVQLCLERVRVVIIRMARQVMHVTMIQQHLLTPNTLAVRMTIHGGASTLEFLPPSPAPPRTTVPVHHVHRASTRPHPPPSVVKYARTVTTLINSPPLPVASAHKDFTLIIPAK